jgi:hypothetical protein
MFDATYDPDDLQFSLRFPRGGGGHCFLCKAPFIQPEGYGVTVEDVNDGCEGDVCDPCARKHAPELLAVRGQATELFHLHRSLAKRRRKRAADRH